tara:strand:- start:10294 stop:10572 length:279 start_codon:yes stop_codon:yes gene_type:complete
MIVRILTEGQYKLSSNYLDQLNEIDNKIVEMVETDNKESFHKLLEEMLNLVRENGTAVPIDEITESDIVLPEPDITINEAGELFTGEGLVPD